MTYVVAALFSRYFIPQSSVVYCRGSGLPRESHKSADT